MQIDWIGYARVGFSRDEQFVLGEFWEIGGEKVAKERRVGFCDELVVPGAARVAVTARSGLVVAPR